MPGASPRRASTGVDGQPVALVVPPVAASGHGRLRERSVTENGTRGRCQLSADPAALEDLGGQPPELVRHLAVALSLHVRNLRHTGAAVPAEVEDLAGLLTRCVRTRPNATPVDGGSGAAHSRRVADRLLVTKGEAAERLSVSVRTIERLVAAGRLPLVHVERAARFRVSDLETYVHDLSEAQVPQSGAGDPS
jgi:excisionase family DNA binding protein